MIEVGFFLLTILYTYIRSLRTSNEICRCQIQLKFFPGTTYMMTCSQSYNSVLPVT